jgi:predicted dienelactone hydrolase
LVTEVWYPGSATGALLEDGPLPLVVWSHGYASSRTAQAALGEHLASHGYVVAAPDFPLSTFTAPGGPTVADVASQPGDVRAVIDHLLGLRAGPLAGAASWWCCATTRRPAAC